MIFLGSYFRGRKEHFLKYGVMCDQNRMTVPHNQWIPLTKDNNAESVSMS